MQIFPSKSECCGCSACKQICPKDAIAMKPDSEGFLYPQIDVSLCIECGACQKICAFQNGYEKNHSKTAYAIKHKDFNTRFTSRSGAAFVALSDYILNKKGSVYGAAFQDDFSVSHIRATDPYVRDKFKGSKYVQSDMKDTFKSVKNDLNNGRSLHTQLHTREPARKDRGRPRRNVTRPERRAGRDTRTTSKPMTRRFACTRLYSAHASDKTFFFN